MISEIARKRCIWSKFSLLLIYFDSPELVAMKPSNDCAMCAINCVFFEEQTIGRKILSKSFTS